MSALKEIPTADINPNELNPRRTVGDVTELAQSIESQGLVQPIVIAPAPDATDGEWVIIAGHRRFAAVQQLGWMHVPALVREDLTDPADVISAMLIENGQRNDLKITEEGDALLALDDLGLTQTEISKRAGRSHKWTKTRITVAGLPEPMRHAVDDGQLTISDAMAYADLPEPTRAQINVNEQPGRIATQVNRQVKVRQNLDKETKIREEATGAGFAEYDPDTDRGSYRSIHVPEGQTPPEGAKFRVDSYHGEIPPMVRWLAPADDPAVAEKQDLLAKKRAEMDAKRDRCDEFAASRFRDLAVVSAGNTGPAFPAKLLRDMILARRHGYEARHILDHFDEDFVDLSDEDAAKAQWFLELDVPALATILWSIYNFRAIDMVIGYTWDDKLHVDQRMVDKLADFFDLELSAEEQEFINENTANGTDGDAEAGAA